MPPVVAVIPARLAAVRFPNKPLAAATGKPLVAHVIERALAARLVDQVIVATPDQAIAQAAQQAGAEPRMTRIDHPNGTSRLAEVARDLEPGSIVINVQGDEPEIASDHIDIAVKTLVDPFDVATLVRPLAADEDVTNPNLVKAVLARHGQALYFSRSVIPHDRLQAPEHPVQYWAHLGIYVYKREFLLEFAAWSPTPLELAESLEQLRVLENGRTIGAAVVPTGFPGIDTPEQYEAFVQRYRARSQPSAS